MKETTFITKSGRAITIDELTHNICQKERNIYQYIPPLSEHNPIIFSNFVFQELKRYSISCSFIPDFNSIVNLFRERLLSRGFPLTILNEKLILLPKRDILLSNIKKRLNGKKCEAQDKVQPIVSLCVPRLLPKLKWGQIFKLPPWLVN